MKMREIVRSKLSIERVYITTLADYYSVIDKIRLALKQEYKTATSWTYDDNRYSLDDTCRWFIAVYNEEKNLYALGAAWHINGCLKTKIVFDDWIYRQKPGWLK